jgi:hypothetical protein
MGFSGTNSKLVRLPGGFLAAMPVFHALCDAGFFEKIKMLKINKKMLD